MAQPPSDPGAPRALTALNRNGRYGGQMVWPGNHVENPRNSRSCKNRKQDPISSGSLLSSGRRLPHAEQTSPLAASVKAKLGGGTGKVKGEASASGIPYGGRYFGFPDWGVNFFGRFPLGFPLRRTPAQFCETIWLSSGVTTARRFQRTSRPKASGPAYALLKKMTTGSTSSAR